MLIYSSHGGLCDWKKEWTISVYFYGVISRVIYVVKAKCSMVRGEVLFKLESPS